jgi:hypothetical protein
MAPRNELKGRISQLVSEHYGYNTSRTVLFLETAVRIRLEAHIRTIVVLTGGKLTGIYFLHLLYASYYFITTHLQKGKKLSILPSGDVNPIPIPSRRGLLEDNLYRAVGVACPSCD